MPAQNFELKNVIGKIYFPYFDGTSKCTVSSQIQKSDTYFHLNPMVERDSIKLATLHLDGEANDWWFHGIRNIGCDQVTAYE